MMPPPSTHVINGKNVSSQTTLPVIDPSTEKVIANVPVATRDQLEETIIAAEHAFPKFAATPLGERSSYLVQIAGIVQKHSTDFVDLLAREVGKDKVTA